MDKKRKKLIGLTWLFFGVYLGLLAFVLPGCKKNQSTSISLIFTNDIHGIYKPSQIDYSGERRLVGGMEALSHYVKVIRSKEKNVILIDNGDIMTGTLASQERYRGVYGGRMIEFLNVIGYDIRSPGNHAFDLGVENAVSSIKLTNFPVIMSNLIYKDSKKLVAPSAYCIIKKAGVRIGFIAVMEEEFFEEVKPENTRGLELLPIVPTLNSYVSKINSKTDAIVVLLHSRFPEGERIAEQVAGIDVVLVASEDGKFNKINGVLVKSTYGHLKTFGYLSLKLKEKKIVSYDEDLKWLWADVEMIPDPRVSKLVNDMDSEISSEYLQNCGIALRDMINRSDSVENPLGNWITDVLRWKTGAQIGLYNLRGIRNSIKKGWITSKDIFEVTPFYNELVVFNITAEQLKEAFERDIERGRDRLQVSGLIYQYYPLNSRPFGQRVWLIRVGDEKVVTQGKLVCPERTFTAVSNDYVVSLAEDKYIGSSLANIKKTGLTAHQVLISWLKEFHTLDYTDENRIERIENKGSK